MSGAFLKGALVQVTNIGMRRIPNVILFQFNPETIEHTWEQADVNGGGGKPGSYSNPRAASGAPGQSFSFTLQMDAKDEIIQGQRFAETVNAGSNLTQVIKAGAYSGLATRLAALELLLFPVNMTVREELVGATNAKNTCEIPQALLPTVIFVWGVGRCLPVRVTSLSITEKLFDAALNPTHVDVKLGLRVLRPEELEDLGKSTDPLAGLAKGLYDYSMSMRRVAAVANTVRSFGEMGFDYITFRGF